MSHVSGRHKTLSNWPNARLFFAGAAEELLLLPLEDPVTPQIPFTVGITPAFDTIRGGTEVVIYTAESILDLSRDQTLRSLVLSAQWAAATAGGGRAVPTMEGLEVILPAVAGASATLTSLDEYPGFDASIVATPSAPVSSAGAVDIAIFRVVSGSDFAQVRLRRGRVGSNVVFFAEGSATISGVATPGSAVALTTFDADFTLRLIRRESRVFGFVDDALILFVDAFSEDDAVLELGAANGLIATETNVRFTDFTVRPGAFINGTPLLNKTIPMDRRIVGNVPPCPQDERGLVDVDVFNFFGSGTAVDGFEYRLPPVRTIARRGNDFLALTNDPALRDPEEES
jgi:hypothetical protein